MNLHQQLGPQPSQPRICKWSSLAAPDFPSRHRLQSACNTRLAFDEVGQDMNGLHAVGLLHAMRVDARGSEGACFPPYKRCWCTGNPHTGSAERRCLASRLGRATGQGILRSSLWLAEQGRLGASTCHPGAARLRVNLGTGAKAAFAWTLRSLAAFPALQSYYTAGSYSTRFGTRARSRPLVMRIDILSTRATLWGLRSRLCLDVETATASGDRIFAIPPIADTPQC